MMEHGPVDVLVMAAGEPQFDGSVLAELERLSDAGIIRVLDLLVLVKGEDGTAERVAIQDLGSERAAQLSFIGEETRGLFDEEDVAAFSEGMVAGSAVGVLAVEHVWAVGLVNALYAAGVDAAMQFRVPAADVEAAFASLGVNA